MDGLRWGGAYPLGFDRDNEWKKKGLDHLENTGVIETRGGPQASPVPCSTPSFFLGGRRGGVRETEVFVVCAGRESYLGPVPGEEKIVGVQ